ncbi:collectin-11 [Elysia marginata]|uniref:Collectin-11 n=1 Tax=Elysia marginata TaxID=1093978 RepID=A0AAV4GHV0_9GAST|nr:collectin-11 [Elysia marginata]
MLVLILSCLLVASSNAQGGSKPTPTIQNTCPPGVISTVNEFYLQVVNETCFNFVVYDRKVYRDASQACKRNGGTLALPKTEDLNDYLADKAYSHYGIDDEVWIGLNDMKDEHHFVWEDQDELDWENFAIHHGLNNRWIFKHIQDCVALDPYDGGWYDYPCDKGLVSSALDSAPKKMFICQY